MDSSACRRCWGWAHKKPWYIKGAGAGHNHRYVVQDQDIAGAWGRRWRIFRQQRMRSDPNEDFREEFGLERPDSLSAGPLPLYIYSSSTSGSLALTESMGCTWMVLITPSRPVLMLCSIFIASTTHTSSPAATRSPGRTMMEITFPGMGLRRILSDGLGADAWPGRGAATI